MDSTHFLGVEVPRLKLGHFLTSYLRDFRQAAIQIVIVVYLARVSEAQVYSPVFKTIDLQATISPLGQMIVGNFYGGHTSIAAISKSEKALYLFEPDSMENLILTNVVSLPDTPIAIAKGEAVYIDKNPDSVSSKIAVLMKSHFVLLVSFGKEGRPIISKKIAVDPYCTEVSASDLETSGKVDILTYGKFALGIYEVRNIGESEFKESRLMQGPLGNIPFNDIAFADFNGDLVPDIAALDWVNHRLLIFYGRGDGTFAQPVVFRLKGEPAALSIADLYGNGYPDILVGYARLNQVDIYSGDGFGRFYLRQTLKTLGPVSQIITDDFVGSGTVNIAAISEDVKNIMIFSRDTSSQNFEYNGSVGIGDNYKNIVSFRFPHRRSADIVASSPVERFIKVFKSTSLFSKIPDAVVPVCADPFSITTFGNDSSSYLIVGASDGRITAINYRGRISPIAARPQIATEWQSQGAINSLVLVPSSHPTVLVSYRDADMVSLYQLLDSDRHVMERTVRTAFRAFAVDGEIKDDSISIAAAYRVHPDSTVGVSYFNSLKNEFIEHDYEVNEKIEYISAELTMNSPLLFLRLWKTKEDSVTLAYTDLRSCKNVTIPIRGNQGKLVNIATRQIFLLESHDTLNVFQLKFTKQTILELHLIYSIPFEGSDFGSISLASMDSSLYLAFYSHLKKEILLYVSDIGNGSPKTIKEWHMKTMPDAIAILPSTNEIFFLNCSESYVTVSGF
jgi:hypothetical protein